MRDIRNIIYESTSSIKDINIMNGFFKNVGVRYKGEDFVTDRRNWRKSIHGYYSYICIIDRQNIMGVNSYIPIYDYYQNINNEYDNLAIKVDIQKIRKDFKLLNLSGLNKYQATIAFLNFISIITDGDGKKIVEYLNSYSNLHQWYVKRENQRTLSYGPTKEIILGEKELERPVILSFSNTDIIDNMHIAGLTINLTKE